MSKDRKASEVLLDLENRVSILAGLIQNIDNNVKLMLDRMNRQAQVPRAQQAVPQPPPQPEMWQPKRQMISAEAPDLPRPQTDKLVARPVQEQPYELDEFGKPELMEEVVHRGKRRDLRQPADSSQSKKVAVSQQVLFPDGKAIFLASVEILDERGQLVKQTRTNSQGRWLAPLDPGDYTVHILKRMGADSKKPPVELRFQVQIPESGRPVELPSPELPDAYR
jgi:hypothetical protein